MKKHNFDADNDRGFIQLDQLYADFCLRIESKPDWNITKFLVTPRIEPDNFAISFAVTDLEAMKYDYPTVVNQRYWKAAARISRWMETP